MRPDASVYVVMAYAHADPQRRDVVVDRCGVRAESARVFVYEAAARVVRLPADGGA
jgi:hypothetical protein